MERVCIAEVMAEKDVDVSEIPNERPFDLRRLSSIQSSSQRFFMCRAFAMFNSHDGCSRRWGSARAWCIVDLKEQDIIHRFKQDCQRCEGGVSPEYDEEAVERMAELAVKTFLRRSGMVRPDPFDLRDMGDALDGATNEPHEEARCDVCRLLGHSCQGSYMYDDFRALPVVSYEVGDLVKCQRGSVPYHGVVKWVGTLPGHVRQVAGIEMEDELYEGHSGDFEGINYFSCEPRCGLFLPFGMLKRDDRFEPLPEDVIQGRRLTESAGEQKEEQVQVPPTVAAPHESNVPSTEAEHDRSDEGLLLFRFPGDQTGLIIGRDGKNIQEVERKTNAKIDIRKPDKHNMSTNGMVLITGTKENCREALHMILESVRQKIARQIAVTEVVVIPNRRMCGRVIGTKGRTRLAIEKLTGARVHIDSPQDEGGLESLLFGDFQPRRCEITGSPEQVKEAKELIQEAIDGNDIAGMATAAAVIHVLMREFEKLGYEFPGEEEMDEEARQIYDDALQDGWVETQMTKVLVTGIAGSGKTSSKHVLFEEEQPEVRQSTPLTEKPIKATRVDKKSSKWIRVGTKKMLKLLAKAIRRYHDHNKSKEMHSTLESEANSSPTSSPTSQDDSTQKPQEDPTPDTEPPPDTQPAASKGAGSSEAVESTSQTEDELLGLLSGIPPSELVDQFDFVQFIDSGGQPEFLEIMPAFLTGDLFCIFVIKLCEKLDEYPKVECYNEKGELVGKPYRATLTNEEFLKHGITTMLSRESQADNSTRQQILIIGTHKDRENECSDKETTEDKNRKLREVVRPYTDNVVFYGNELKHLIFPLNARSPEKKDHAVAEKIRSVIARCSPEPVRIPIRWYCFELRVKELAENEGRSVLSTEECFTVAHRLHFNEKSFVAALEFLHKLSSISYFREFLKGVVFSDPQVLVDIVSEIVEALQKLSQETPSGDQGVFEGDWKKMRDYGIVSMERLKSFKQHRVPGLFTYKEVIELFKALLILAVFDESSYFMPCLLRRLRTTEVDEYRVSASSNVAPLLIHFPQGPRRGVFCSITVFLLSSDNQSPTPWKLRKTTEDAPMCLYRNCIKFVIPGYPATITLIDSFSSFEVHINIRPDLCKKFCGKLCPLVRDAVLDGLEKSRRTLHYSNWEAEVGFFCPCNKGTPHRAHSAFEQDSLICSQDPDECGQLEDQHRLWGPLPTPHPVGGTCMQSGRLSCDGLGNVLRELATVFAKWRYIGLELKLSPGTLDAMKGPYKTHQDCMTDMLTTWLNTSTGPSWKDITKALKSPLVCQDALARELETKYCY